MSFTSKGANELVVAGCQDTMFKIDVETGSITQTVRGFMTSVDDADIMQDSNPVKLHNNEKRRSIHLRS